MPERLIVEETLVVRKTDPVCRSSHLLLVETRPDAFVNGIKDEEGLVGEDWHRKEIGKERRTLSPSRHFSSGRENRFYAGRHPWSCYPRPLGKPTRLKPWCLSEKASPMLSTSHHL